MLRSIGLVHGAAMPGTANLANLTNAPRILLQLDAQYPIADPRRRGTPYDPLGTLRVTLQMRTDYPCVEYVQIDVSQLDWQRLPCPPAPYSFEWSPILSAEALLVDHGGDYYVGWDRGGAGLYRDFYAYQMLRTKCVPSGGTFGTIPDQVTVVGANYDPDTGAAAFVAVVLPNDHEQFVRGDANDDGRVDIADAVHIIDYLFRHGVLRGRYDSADVNDDGVCDLSDVITCLMYLFRSDADGMLRAPYWEMAPGVKGMDPTP